MLLLSGPLLLLAMAAVRIGGRPVVFSQRRLGRDGTPFDMHKLRTLAAPDGPSVAPTGDQRTTTIGRWLRRWHIDELPQLVDVLRGDMALVGPRPEVPDNLVAASREQLQRVQSVRPGMTGPTQLRFLGEDDVLAECADPQGAYREVIVPHKVAQDAAWLNTRTLRGDLLVLLRTPVELLSRQARARSRAMVRALLAGDADGSAAKRPPTPAL